MAWIIRLISVLFLLAALHNWDLFCGTKICRGMTNNMEVTYMSRVALFGFIGLVMLVYDVNLYFAVRYVQYYDTRVEVEAIRVPPDRIIYNKEKGYYIEKVESVF